MTLDEKRRQKKLAKKAAERKARLAQRSSITHRDSGALAARSPIGDCLVSTSLFEEGIGHVVLTRALPGGDLAVAGFLVDTYCLGVKNALYRGFSSTEFELYRRQIEQLTPLESIHPSCLRKLVEGAVRYARDLGFLPHSDYARAARLFGDIDAAACPVRYSYGKDGKPFYINGPNETPAQSRRILETLARKLGPDGFHHLTALGSPEEGALAVPGRSIHLISYQISDEPMEDTAYARLPQAVKDELEKLHYQVTDNPREAVVALGAMIERYPDVPQIYNYQHAAYTLLGDKANAKSVLDEILEHFPDYLFGRIAQASGCLERGEIDRIPEIFEGKYDLKLLYPERECFHTSEVLHFDAIMARYFHALGEDDRAEMYYKMLHRIDPNHQTTQMVRRLLHPTRIEALLRMLAAKR